MDITYMSDSALQGCHDQKLHDYRRISAILDPEGHKAATETERLARAFISQLTLERLHVTQGGKG